MKNLSLVLFIFILCFILIPVCYSQEDVTVEIAEFGFSEEMVITASKKAETISEAPAIVSVITEEQIREMGAKTLADILKIIPGIEIRYTVFGLYEMAIRGIYSPPDILFLIDGHRVNDFYDGIPPYYMSVNNVKRIEVIRGPGSALYGTNAFVGIVNVITKEDFSGLEILARGGTFNTDKTKLLSEINALRSDTTNVDTTKVRRKIPQLSDILYGADKKNPLLDTYQMSILCGKKWGNWSIGGFFEYEDTDGPKLLIKNDSEFKPNVKRSWAAAPGNTVDWKKKTNININTGYKKLKFRGKLLMESRGPNIGEYETLTPDTKVKSTIYLGSLIYEFSPAEKMNVLFKAYSDIQSKDKYIQSFPPGYSEDINRNKVYEDSLGEVFPEGKIKHTGYNATTFGCETQLNYTLPKMFLWTSNDIVSGFQIEHSKLSDFFFNTNYRSSQYVGRTLSNYNALLFKQNGKTRTVSAVYLQDSWYLSPKILAGRYFEFISYLGITSGVRYDHYSDFGSTTNPRIGLVLQAVKHRRYNTSLILKALYGRAFRAPTFQNLYDLTGGSLRTPYFGNEKLEPEKISTMEVGTELKVKDIVSLRGNIFRNQIKDKIEYIDIGGPATVNVIRNFGGTRITGYEAESKTFIKKKVDFFFNYSSFKAIDTEGLPPDEYGFVSPMVDSNLTYIPLRRANVGINVYPEKHININLTMVMVDSCKNNSRIVMEALAHRFKAPGYRQTNLTLTGKNLYNKLSVAFSIYNLFNDNVVEPLMIYGLDTTLPRPKRNFSLELSYKH